MSPALRLAAPQDAAALAAIYAPYVENTTVSFEYTPPDAAEMARRMAQREGAFPTLVAEEAGRVLGYASAGRLAARQGYDWACETSIYLAQDITGKGLGGLLYGGLLPLLAQQGYRTAWAILAIPNPASERFHEKLGFVRQGLLQDVGYKFGRPLSVGYYVRPLLLVGQNPSPPVPFSHLDAEFVQDILCNPPSL